MKKRGKGKIVLIESDNLGNTYCGYCHKKVDYQDSITLDELFEILKQEVKK